MNTVVIYICMIRYEQKLKDRDDDNSTDVKKVIISIYVFVRDRIYLKIDKDWNIFNTIVVLQIKFDILCILVNFLILF